jgi:hypothetical protein
VPTKARVLANLAGQMSPDGALYLGSAETALGVTTRLCPCRRARGIWAGGRGGEVAGLRRCPQDGAMPREIRLNAFDMACIGHIQHGM